MNKVIMNLHTVHFKLRILKKITRKIVFYSFRNKLSKCEKNANSLNCFGSLCESAEPFQELP